MFDTLFVSDDLSHDREVENVGKIYWPFFRYFFFKTSSVMQLFFQIFEHLPWVAWTSSYNHVFVRNTTGTSANCSIALRWTWVWPTCWSSLYKPSPGIIIIFISHPNPIIAVTALVEFCSQLGFIPKDVLFWRLPLFVFLFPGTTCSLKTWPDSARRPVKGARRKSTWNAQKWQTRWTSVCQRHHHCIDGD